MKRVAAIGIMFLLLASLTNADSDRHRGWNLEDEGPHGCIREWWNIDLYLTANDRYHLTSSFEYETETPAANLFFTLFNLDSCEVFELGSFEDDIFDLQCGGARSINLSYGDSWLRGAYSAMTSVM